MYRVIFNCPFIKIHSKIGGGGVIGMIESYLSVRIKDKLQSILKTDVALLYCIWFYSDPPYYNFVSECVHWSRDLKSISLFRQWRQVVADCN